MNVKKTTKLNKKINISSELSNTRIIYCAQKFLFDLIKINKFTFN